MAGILIRVFVYIFVAVFLAELIRLELLHAAGEKAFTEYGYVQWAQSLFLLLSSTLLFINAQRDVVFRQLSKCMALFFLILLIRENDQPLELLLPHGSWKFIIIIPAAVLAWYFWKNRQQVIAQLTAFSQSFSFGIMASGFVVLIFSRFFGRRSFWQLLMGDDFIRTAKNAAEEGVEVLALGLILVSVVEFLMMKKTLK